MGNVMADRFPAPFWRLADPTRRAILAQIADGAQTVNASGRGEPLCQPGISKHLKVLEEAGLIRRERVAKTRPVHLEARACRRRRAGSTTTASTGRVPSTGWTR